VKATLKGGLNPKLWADFNPLDYVKSEINSAEGRGFRLVRIVSGVALIMEKAGGPEGEGEGPKSSPTPYRSFTSLEGAKLQRKLKKEALSGYCLGDIDPEAPASMWPSFLLYKTGTPVAGDASEPCTYEVAQKPDLTEDDLNQAGARGFRLVPQSVNFYGLYPDARTKPRANAIFEKIPTRTHVYRYRDISAPELSELPGKLEQAAADGYRAIKVDITKGDAVLVIMQKSEDLPNK